MSKEKEIKTNAMRILDKNKIPYNVKTYEVNEFIDGIQVADKLGLSYDMTFKTLVSIGKSNNYFVFVIPVDQELDLKAAAKAVGEKSVALIHVKDIQKITGYIRGGCTPVGMKKLFPTVIHNTAKDMDTMIISGGRIGSQLTLSPKALADVTGAQFADIIMHHSTMEDDNA